MDFRGNFKLIFYFFIKDGRKKSIFKSREDNWLSIKTSLDFVPTLVAAGDERQFKIGVMFRYYTFILPLKNTVS